MSGMGQEEEESKISVIEVSLEEIYELSEEGPRKAISDLLTEILNYFNLKPLFIVDFYPDWDKPYVAYSKGDAAQLFIKEYNERGDEVEAAKALKLRGTLVILHDGYDSAVAFIPLPSQSS